MRSASSDRAIRPTSPLVDGIATRRSSGSSSSRSPRPSSTMSSGSRTTSGARGRARPRRMLVVRTLPGPRLPVLGASWAGLVVALVAAAIVASACDSSASTAPPGSHSSGPAPVASSTAPPVGGDGGGGGGSGPPGAAAGGGPTGSADPSASVPPTTPPASSPPGSDSTPFGGAAKGLRGEVFAFVTTDQVAAAADTLDYDATSTIVFFSLQAGANGDIQQGSTLRAWNSAATDHLIERAHAT